MKAGRNGVVELEGNREIRVLETGRNMFLRAPKPISFYCIKCDLASEVCANGAGQAIGTKLELI